MKKIIVALFSITVASCSTASIKTSDTNKLYEVLDQQSNGGASIRFFEILTEPNEIKMLQNDDSLKHKITTTDVQNANFVILNMGEKTTGGYSIGIQDVVETDSNIIVTVKENSPEAGSMVSQSFSSPYCVLKINSKKPIVFK